MMALVYQLERWVHLKQMRKSFFLLSILPLALIPVDWLSIHFKTNSSAAPLSIQPDILKTPRESLSAYQLAFEKSSLFGNISNQPLIADRVAIAEIVKDYRLKGVVIMNEPEAMIEDARTQKINYLRKGSQVGELVVKEIKEGLVVLLYGTQEARLEIQ